MFLIPDQESNSEYVFHNVTKKIKIVDQKQERDAQSVGVTLLPISVMR